MNVLVLGASGLLGNAMFRVLAQSDKITTFGTIRDSKDKNFFIPALREKLLLVEDLEHNDNLLNLFNKGIRFDVVINCVALDKHQFNNCLKMISIFSVLPKKLDYICERNDIKLVQISSDGVFSGKKGGYTEEDIPDANDIYGISKLLGEAINPKAITLRTSMIGHELNSKQGVLEWFLSQDKECKGYTKAFFSGFPTIVLAKIIRDIILPRHDLHGVFHLATQPISKFDLLQLIAKKYGKIIKVIPDESVIIDRTLSDKRFFDATGYRSPDWNSLIDEMYLYKFGLLN